MNVLGLSPVLAIVAGVRAATGPRARRRGCCFALGFALFWLGDLYTYSYPRLFDREVPFPSIGDGAYLLVYPALMAGLLMLVRRRNPQRDRAGAHRRADHDARPRAAVVGRAHRALPARRHDRRRREARLDRVPAGRRPAARRRHPPRRRRRPPRARVPPARSASIVALLVTDFVYGLVPLHGAYDHQLCSTSAGSASTCSGAPPRCTRRCASSTEPAAGPRAAPDADPPGAADVRLADRPGRRARPRDAPGDVDLLVIVGASVVLFGLVVARMAGLVRQQERSSDRERVLSGAGSALVARDRARRALRGGHAVGRRAVPRLDERVRAPRARRAADRRGPGPAAERSPGAI